MNDRTPEEAVAVVVAATDAPATVGASLAGFLTEVAGRGEVVLIDASRDGTADEAARRFPAVRILRRPPGALVPELWRDGLDATDAPLVAFTTAAMVPRPGWLAALRARLAEADAAGVGGPIEPGPALSALDRAVFLHRFARYRPPFPAGVEPPGDNALYRRDRLRVVASSWAGGFWEVEVHRHLRARGERLALAPAAPVAFLGGSHRAATLRRRVRHARRYASDRSGRSAPAGRLARLAAVPAVPAVLWARLARTLVARGEPLGPWLPALPDLALLLGAWTLGEAWGLCRRTDDAVPSENVLKDPASSPAIDPPRPRGVAA